MTNVRSLPTIALRSATSGAILTALATLTPAIAAQEPTTQELLQRIEAQDRRIAELQNPQEQSASSASLHAPKPGGIPLTATFDKGFRLRSTDPTSPFELKINGRMQFRVDGFNADKDAAIVNSDQANFEIERGRLELSGTFFDKNTHFYLNLDADTDDNHRVIFHDFWVNYDVAKNHSIYVGKAFVPGSREWLGGSTSTHLIDRSMATSFFRPDRTLGIWAIGKVFDDINYRIMVGNGFNTTDLSSGQIDANPIYSGSFWIDPLASFGKGFADLEQHEDLAVRFGTSVTHTRQDEGQGAAQSEANFARVGQDMKLTSMGVDKFDFYLGAVDAAFKYRGLAANSEFFYRWIDNVETTAGPAARTSYYDWGGTCDLGYMLVEKTLEPVIRVSTVQGINGDSWEYAACVNYYVDGTHLNKLSADIAKMDGSPVSNSGPGYRTGDDGWMFRLQWQIAF